MLTCKPPPSQPHTGAVTATLVSTHIALPRASHIYTVDSQPGRPCPLHREAPGVARPAGGRAWQGQARSLEDTGLPAWGQRWGGQGPSPMPSVTVPCAPRRTLLQMHSLAVLTAGGSSDKRGCGSGQLSPGTAHADTHRRSLSTSHLSAPHGQSHECTQPQIQRGSPSLPPGALPLGSVEPWLPPVCSPLSQDWPGLRQRRWVPSSPFHRSLLSANSAPALGDLAG